MPRSEDLAGRVAPGYRTMTPPLLLGCAAAHRRPRTAEMGPYWRRDDPCVDNEPRAVETVATALGLQAGGSDDCSVPEEGEEGRLMASPHNHPPIEFTE